MRWAFLNVCIFCCLPLGVTAAYAQNGSPFARPYDQATFCIAAVAEFNPLNVDALNRWMTVASSEGKKLGIPDDQLHIATDNEVANIERMIASGHRDQVMDKYRFCGAN